MYECETIDLPGSGGGNDTMTGRSSSRNGVEAQDQSSNVFKTVSVCLFVPFPCGLQHSFRLAIESEVP
jgi:hypothetical protein